jgi:hypothetical protein
VDSKPLSPTLLEQAGLFTFEGEAQSHLSGFFERITPQVELEAQTQGALLQELVHLTAAEYALAPALQAPRPMLPLKEPVRVDQGAALLALAKADCSILWPDCPTGRAQRLTLASVTAFSGDISKLALVGVSAADPPSGIGDLARAVDDLERLHRRASDQHAQELGASGVLRLQGFLWAVKLSLPEGSLESAVKDAFDAFELTQPASGGLVRT